MKEIIPQYTKLTNQQKIRHRVECTLVMPRHWWKIEFEGILPKGPHLPGTALLAGYRRIVLMGIALFQFKYKK